MAEVSGNRRSIFADFAIRRSDEDSLIAWLSEIVDGRVPDDVFVPSDEHPIEHFLGVLRQRATPDDLQPLARAAGALLCQWISRHAEDPQPGEKALDRLSNILYILECVPIPASQAWQLLLFIQGGAPDQGSQRGRELRRQALNALSLSLPPERNFEQLASFYREEIQKPDYAVPAFNALMRLSLPEAVREVPPLLNTMKTADPPLPPEHVLRALFRSLERHPGVATQLGEIVRAQPAVDAELKHILVKVVRAPERFPTAWQSYHEALGSSTEMPAGLRELIDPYAREFDQSRLASRCAVQAVMAASLLVQPRVG